MSGRSQRSGRVWSRRPPELVECSSAHGDNFLAWRNPGRGRPCAITVEIHLSKLLPFSHVRGANQCCVRASLCIRHAFPECCPQIYTLYSLVAIDESRSCYALTDDCFPHHLLHRSFHIADDNMWKRAPRTRSEQGARNCMHCSR